MHQKVVGLTPDRVQSRLQVQVPVGELGRGNSLMFLSPIKVFLLLFLSIPLSQKSILKNIPLGKD